MKLYIKYFQTKISQQSHTESQGLQLNRLKYEHMFKEHNYIVRHCVKYIQYIVCSYICKFWQNLCCA